MEKSSSKLFEFLSKQNVTSQSLSKYLESNKTDVDEKNNKGETPLTYLLKNGREDLAIILIENGSDTNLAEGSLYDNIVEIIC